MKTIIFSILVLLILPLTVYSQVINFIKVENSAPSYSTVSDYSHIRVKYDPWGNVRIITYDGKRFFEVIYKNGYFSSFKPVAKGKISIPELTTTEVNFYDFEIDTSGVIHIAFTVFLRGISVFDSHKVYMFYTNSQADSVFYLGKTSFPVSSFGNSFNWLNVLKTTDNKIVINYLHFLREPSYVRLKWTQLVNHSASNIQPKYREIGLPEFSANYMGFFNAFVNKNLYVNVYQFYSTSYTDPSQDTLYTKYYFLKYDINNPSNDAIVYESGSAKRPSTLLIPTYAADYNDGSVQISKVIVNFDYNSQNYRVGSPLDNAIFTLDRENKLHVLAYSNNQATYYQFDNLPIADLSGSSLSHTVDKSKFFPFNLGNFSGSYLNFGSMAALNPNNAVFLFNHGEYLIHQLQGNFIYKIITPEIFGPYPLKELELVVKDNNIYLFNATRTYANLNDSTGILPLYEIREQNNEFRTDFDNSSIINIQFQNVPGFKYPFAKVDKNNQIHLLMFKFLKYGPAQSELGQWYYYKITNNLQVQGGYRVTAESDTVYILSPIEFDVDGNGNVHVVYFRYLENNKSVMVYTNNSSGTFATPIVIPDTLSSTVSGNWFRVKATRDGKAYIVYYNWVESKVNVIYGDLNGFTSPKLLLVHSGIDRGGGRNKVSFEVDYYGNLHCFDMSDYPQYLRYAYKVIRDSVIYVGKPYPINNLVPQFVTTAQDKDWNIYVIGVTDNEKVYYLHSLDNFQSFRTYDIANYGIFNFLPPYDEFWDYFKPLAVSERGRIYFYLGIPFDYHILGWIPILPTEVEKDGSLIPSNFILYQNYPNPFNPSTYISFDLPRNVKVKVSVYDVLGRLVKVLVDGEMPAGKHRIEFRGDGLPSGVYFYRLEAGDFMDVKKMMLIK